jgi:hypothetical protein
MRGRRIQHRALRSNFLPSSSAPRDYDKDARWLTAERVRAYATILLAFMAAALAVSIVMGGERLAAIFAAIAHGRCHHPLRERLAFRSRTVHGSGPIATGSYRKRTIGLCPTVTEPARSAADPPHVGRPASPHNGGFMVSSAPAQDHLRKVMGATGWSTTAGEPPARRLTTSFALSPPCQSDARRRCASFRFFSTRRPLWIATSGGTSVVTSARYAITPDAAYAEALPIRLDWLAGCPRLSCCKAALPNAMTVITSWRRCSAPPRQRRWRSAVVERWA